MKVAKIISVGVGALIVASSASWAEQARVGVITEINRLNNTIAIRQMQNGTVGANTSGASEAFKVQTGVSLDDWHAGDKVSYSANEAGGTKTITKIERQ
jgi:copper binding protein CusF